MVVDQIVESRIWYRHTALIWIDGAEREILSGRSTFCQHIEECRFANIWHTNNAHTKICTNTANQWLAFGFLNLFWWHLKDTEHIQSAIIIQITPNLDANIVIHKSKFEFTIIARAFSSYLMPIHDIAHLYTEQTYQPHSPKKQYAILTSICAQIFHGTINLFCRNMQFFNYTF